MKRLNLPLILDTVFTAVCAFLLFFTAIRFYTKSAVIGLIFGIVAAVLFGAIAFLYISGKQNKSLLISRDERDKKLLSLHLSLSSAHYILNLFKQCFEESKIRGKRLICGGQSVFFDFKMQPITEDDIAYVIKFKTPDKKVVYCNGASPEASALAEHFSIEVCGINEIYPMLKKKNLLPEKYVYEEAKKINVFKKIKNGFSRKICAPLFWSGVGLLVLSYFTFYPVYYIVCGSLMLLISAIALVINAH